MGLEGRVPTAGIAVIHSSAVGTAFHTIAAKEKSRLFFVRQSAYDIMRKILFDNNARLIPNRKDGFFLFVFQLDCHISAFLFVFYRVINERSDNVSDGIGTAAYKHLGTNIRHITDIFS